MRLIKFNSTLAVWANRLYFVDLRFHRIPPVLLRQTGLGHHLVFYRRSVSDRVDRRSFSHPLHGSPSRFTLSHRRAQLQRGLDSTHLSWIARYPPLLLGKVADWNHLPAHRGYFGDRLSLRSVDSQRSGGFNQQSIPLDRGQPTIVPPANTAVSIVLLSKAIITLPRASNPDGKPYHF